MFFSQRDILDQEIMGKFGLVLKIMAKNPSRLAYYMKAMHHQKQALQLRSHHAEHGLEVPPILIFSITRRCNLNCAGCYSKILHDSDEAELSLERYAAIFREAVELGISIVLLAGGEPLVRKEVLECAAGYDKILFPVFTNGLLIDAEYADFFAKNPNLLPVLSLEGDISETDERRGNGVYYQVRKAVDLLNERNTLWGCSITLTSENFSKVLSDQYVGGLVDGGCKLFFYVEYVPVQTQSEHLVLDDDQKAAFKLRIKELRSSHPALFVPLPGDEDYFEGCLAAGRGFLHINPSGRVEPCPFAPFSDTNLSFSSIKEALASKLLKKIRENHSLLSEGKGGCALWANKEFVQTLL
jgi:MoaA/NifB/PqqE/SkfB family radical SAM enzyme